MKLLVDECLSPDLVRLARARGHGESSHIVWLKRVGWKDWNLKRFILDGDWTFVTKNSVDFRGLVEKPGSKGQYAGVAIHAGLFCLNSPAGMDLHLMIEWFGSAVDELDRDGDLIDQILDVSLDSNDIHILQYGLPP